MPPGESCLLTVGTSHSSLDHHGSLLPMGSEDVCVEGCVAVDHVERHTSESVRTEVEVALAKTLDLRPEAAQVRH